MIATEKERLGTAADAFDRAATLDPAVAEYHARAGYGIYRLIANPRFSLDDAVAKLNKAIRLDQDNVTYREWLGEVYRHQGKTEAAIKVYQSIMEKDPKNDEARRQVHYLTSALEKQREQESKDPIRSLFGRKP
ncbi:MAG: tetratricopeptide repeat protein [Deltaproteobacteria bacterium]|nr:tetratricopeptide repeat protein [Deltaproteobacteria bacterium]